MQLESMVGRGEKTLWSGRPDKKCFILESVFNPLLPFALIWAAIDIFILNVTLSSDTGAEFIVPFILIHMMPVWLYLGGLVTVVLKYRHEAYLITDRAVYTSHGVVSVNYDTKLFADMAHVDVHRGVFDQMIGVGDVVINADNGTIAIVDISDYEEVFKMVKQLQQDVYSDVQYPNAYRPAENPGYSSAYTYTPDKDRKQ